MSSSAIAAQHQGRCDQRWSDERIIAELRASAERHGKLRVLSFTNDYRRGLTTLDLRTVFLRFGSWVAACDAAGHAPGRTLRTYTRMTEADCVAAIVEVAGALGQMPSIGDYDAVRAVEPERGLPSNATVRGRCGGWLRALQMAEAEVEKRPRRG